MQVKGTDSTAPRKDLPSKVCFTPAAPHRVAMEQPSNVCNTKLERTFDREAFVSPLSTQFLQVMNPPLVNTEMPESSRAFLVSKAAEITC